MLDDRVLLMAPTRKDAVTTCTLLRGDGITAEVCPSFDAALEELERGAAAMVIPEETVTTTHVDRLSAFLRLQPPWSDLPVLVLTERARTRRRRTQPCRALGNVTLLERPVRVATLLTAIRTALRARQRQYQIREHLFERSRTEAALRDADQRKDEFLATLSHELRNPLAPLVSGLDVLRMTVHVERRDGEDSGRDGPPDQPPSTSRGRPARIVARDAWAHIRAARPDRPGLDRQRCTRHDPAGLRRRTSRRDASICRRARFPCWATASD